MIYILTKNDFRRNDFRFFFGRNLMFDLLLPKKTFTVEMIISKKVGNHFLLGNGSQPPNFYRKANTTKVFEYTN